MLYSKLFVPTLREAPQDADTVSAKLMLRAGLIRKVASGIYEWLPLGLKVLKKVEAIVRAEMDAAGGQEVWMPVIQPKELWVETGRWQVYGKELLRLKDRKGGEFCFAPTAEEVITDLVRREVRSWRQLPVTFYQFGTKFRDEIRPRFGVMRAREFYMKDAYSFHADDADCDATYKKMYAAYERVFQRCGLRFKPVEAQSGAIGGSFSHEFMVLAETGEETVVLCNSCGYAANLERAEVLHEDRGTTATGLLKPIEEVATPGLASVEDVAQHMKALAPQFIKALVYIADGKPVMVLIRGDHELNEQKLLRQLGATLLEKASEEEYRAATGSEVGFAGPIGQKERMRVLADFAVKHTYNAIAGGNRKDLHLRNVNYGRDFDVEAFGDLRKMISQDPCPRCRAKVEFTKGIEVGHTFKLGTKYSVPLNATYLDAAQKSRPIIMGCYGIGVSRVVASAIEQNHDENGICWPAPLAPYPVVLIATDVKDERVMETARLLQEQLTEAGLEPLLDDRDERAGVKFKDADLLGMPWRVTISPKTLAQGSVEVKARTAKEQEFWKVENASAQLRERLQAPAPKAPATAAS